MRNPNQIKATKCMSCGAPVTKGLFCARCVEEGAKDEPKADGWKGSRFSEERKQRVRQQMLHADLKMWGKRAVVLTIAALTFLGGWKMFGDRIQTEFHEAVTVFKPAERDPTNAHPVPLDAKGNPVGTDQFSHKYNR